MIGFDLIQSQSTAFFGSLFDFANDHYTFFVLAFIALIALVLWRLFWHASNR